MEIYRSISGEEVAVVAATWEINQKVTKESLADEFISNRAKALKNYASIVTHNVEAAIKDKDMIVRIINTARQCPFDYTRNKFYEWFRGTPGIRYFIHFDLSQTKDATGIAMVHRLANGAIVVDFMLRVEVPFGRQINFAQMREDYIYELSSRGFHIELVTYDGFASIETRQILEEKGFHTDYESADKSPDPYDTLIELIGTTDKSLEKGETNRRIDYYSYPRFVLEMEELKLVNGTRYDHPKKNKFGKPGSKDVADAVACATHKAIESHLENEHPHQPALVISRAQKNSPYRSNYGETSRF